MKKKRINDGPAESPPCGACGETEYEALRSAVLEGGGFQANKGDGLDVVIARGMAAWILKRQDANPRKIVKAGPPGQGQTAEALAILLANLLESGAAV